MTVPVGLNAQSTQNAPAVTVITAVPINQAPRPKHKEQLRFQRKSHPGQIMRISQAPRHNQLYCLNIRKNVYL